MIHSERAGNISARRDQIEIYMSANSADELDAQPAKMPLQLAASTVFRDAAPDFGPSLRRGGSSSTSHADWQKEEDR
jgi:hypothetical protein